MRAIELYICVQRLHGGLKLKRRFDDADRRLFDTVVAARIKDKGGHCNVDEVRRCTQ